MSLFRTKPLHVLMKSAESTHGLRRVLGPWNLIALGIGAIIGTGIFVIIGEAIGTAGPSIVLSFIIAGVTCMFSALAPKQSAGMP